MAQNDSVSNESELDKLSLSDRREIIIQIWRAVDKLERSRNVLLKLVDRLSSGAPPPELPEVAPQTLPRHFELSDSPALQPTVRTGPDLVVVTFQLWRDPESGAWHLKHDDVGLIELPTLVQRKCWHEIGRYAQRTEAKL
jgi:hypothetical protein